MPIYQIPLEAESPNISLNECTCITITAHMHGLCKKCSVL